MTKQSFPGSIGIAQVRQLARERTARRVLPRVGKSGATRWRSSVPPNYSENGVSSAKGEKSESLLKVMMHLFFSKCCVSRTQWAQFTFFEQEIRDVGDGETSRALATSRMSCKRIYWRRPHRGNAAVNQVNDVGIDSNNLNQLLLLLWEFLRPSSPHLERLTA